MPIRMKNPGYIDLAKDFGHTPISVRPPILFRDVTARVFPLKANMARLTQFCDTYLNMDIPDQIVHFTPAMPYVYFMVLNYGGMTATSLEAQRVGWIAQHEVTFTVPLQRWRRIDGKLVFQDWASVSPFIYVDDSMSQTTGREVYGWPKVLAHIDADTPMWTTHPRSSTRLFSMSTNIFAGAYAGQADTPRTLVEVIHEPSPSYTEFPPDLNSAWMLASAVPNMVRNAVSLMGDAVDLTAGLRIRGYPPGRNLDALMAMAGKAGSMVGNMLSGLLLPSLDRKDAAGTDANGTDANDPAAVVARSMQQGMPQLFAQTINLKQFRDPESPQLACYTALVNSSMGVDRLNGTGLLGDWDLLRGDPSGGFRVRIHQYTAQPIIESLGIEIPISTQKEREGALVTLKPSFPYWVDCDLYYGAGESICSRTAYLGARSARKLGVWSDDQKQQTNAPPVINLSQNIYNNALGAATQPVVGPFHFPDVTVQVYPLLADRVQLDSFVDRCWNQPFEVPKDGDAPRLRFETMGSYVYLVVNVIGEDRGTMWSNNNNIGWWAEREVSFRIPVKWYKDDKLISVAMIEPFVYADNGRAVITDREVNGRNTVVATIDSPADVWMAPSGPAGNRRLLQLTTEMFRAVNLGQKSEQLTLLEIDELDVLRAEDTAGWQGIADTWGRTLTDDLKRKTWLATSQKEQATNVKAFALEILAHEAPINRITMKQYRDAADVDRACYQAAVHIERSITRVYDIREIEQRVHVRVHRSAGHPIVDALGLQIKSVDSIDGEVIDILQPIRPFWMHIAVKEELGTIIGTVDYAVEPDPRDKADADLKAVRSWEFSHPWFRTADYGVDASAPSRPLGDPYFAVPEPTRVNKSLVWGLDNGDCQDLRDKANNWLRICLTNELALIKVGIAALDATAQTSLGHSAEKTDATLLHLYRLLVGLDPDHHTAGATTFRSFCDSMSLDQMTALIQAIRQASDDAQLGLPALDDISEAISQKLLVYLLREKEQTESPEPPEAGEPVGGSSEPGKPGAVQGVLSRAVGEMPDLSGLHLRDPGLISSLKFVISWVMQPPDKAGLAWNDLAPVLAVYCVTALQLNCWAIEQFEPERLRLLEMTSSNGVRDALTSLKMNFDPKPESKTKFLEMQKDYDTRRATLDWIGGPLPMDPTSVLDELVIALDQAVSSWKSPSTWRRLTRETAAASVDTLGDVQIVIESILSDEWESRDTYLRTRLDRDAKAPLGANPKRKPDQCVPVGSIGPLGLPANSWAATHGLRRWPEDGPDKKGNWEFVSAERTTG